MKTVRLTMAQALVKFLIAQKTEIDGIIEPLFPGVFGIFGHGNVTCLAEALEAEKGSLPTWRGQNEQSMALAAVAYAKAKRRRQIMIAASSIGPGATNMVTTAAVAHANRLPLLMLSGDVFSHRLPDPVLQQIENFHDPTITVNDAFKPVTRYWDRFARPEQLLSSLPQAIATLLDPADCGPALLALPQDIQGEAFDYPVVFFEPTMNRVPRPRADPAQIVDAVNAIRLSKKPIIIAGGGVHYSIAGERLAVFAREHNIPVAETIAGRAVLTHDHEMNVGPIGINGSTAANSLAADADLVLAIGTRLQDFTTGSWSIFQNPGMRIVSVNAARFDSRKHRAVPIVGDALLALDDLSTGLSDWKASERWTSRAAAAYRDWNEIIASKSGPTNTELPSYAQVVGAINRNCDPTDLVISAAGGLPGEVCKNWRVKTPGTFDCEFGYSCMGYEIAGGWGAKMANPERDVVVFTGDGSYLMMNSDIYSSVLTDHKLIIVVCDNGGFAIIDLLQGSVGGVPFNNMIKDCNITTYETVDFLQHAKSMGALGEKVLSIAELEQAFKRAKDAERTYVIWVKTDPNEWTPGGAWWDLGVPEVSDRQEVRDAHRELLEQKKNQRMGV